MTRILFLDDDRKVRDLLRETLERRGYRVRLLEDAPPMPLTADQQSAACCVLLLEPVAPQASLLVALLRAFAAWNC